MASSTSDRTGLDHSIGLFRGLAGGRAGGCIATDSLGAALLGGWPADEDGPASGLRALASLVVERDPAAPGLVRAMVAAQPAAVTQLARLSKFTSLQRALDGLVSECDAGECQARMRDLASGAFDDVGDLAAVGARVAAWAAEMASGRNLSETDTRVLAGLAGLEARCRLARAQQCAARLEGSRTDTTERNRLVSRWHESARDLACLSESLAGAEAVDPQAIRSRLASRLGSTGMAALVAGAESWPGGQRLARILKQLAQPQLRVEDPGSALGRIMEVVEVQGDRPLLAADPDPLLLAVIVLERGRGAWLVLDLPGERLANARRRGFEPPEGVDIVGESLHIACTPAGMEPPAAPNRARAAAAEEEKDEGAAALRQLVLTNLGTISVLLEFLRDAKVISLPGLVEEVTNRTRNPQVLETIATTRNLHTGFANRNVPLALLRSPVNVSVRTLRRFIHVKFVSKLELKRMAADKSGLRKEVHREIEKYLTTLA